MATMQFLSIAGVSFFTIRGSVTEQHTGQATLRAPRRWELEVVLETLQQELVLRQGLRGATVPVSLPHGETLSSALLLVTAIPVPHRPVGVSVTIHEII